MWKLDLLARSLCDLIAMVDDFDRRGVNFRSLTEEISTTTPGGKLTFHIFVALAEFERGIIIERTREGIKAARARGVRGGPKPKLDRKQIDHARKLLKQDPPPSREELAALFKGKPADPLQGACSFKWRQAYRSGRIKPALNP